MLDCAYRSSNKDAINHKKCCLQMKQNSRTVLNLLNLYYVAGDISWRLVFSPDWVKPVHTPSMQCPAAAPGRPSDGRFTQWYEFSSSLLEVSAHGIVRSYNDSVSPLESKALPVSVWRSEIERTSLVFPRQ